MPKSRTIDPGPVWVYLLALTGLFVRFGYNIGAGDQDELVPFLMSLLDPTLFQSDWFVQLQTAEIGVRTYVVWLLYPLARVATIPAAVTTLYLASWLFVAWAAYRMARHITGNPTAAAVAVLLTLGVFHKWTLGSNDLVYSMFVGEMVAWGFALYGLERWLDGRSTTAAILIGIASWFQLLVGLLPAGIMVVERVWQRLASESREPPRSDMISLGVFIVASLPAVVPIALQQFDALSSDKTAVFYILAPFRNPFHHMFFSFGAKSIIRFGAMLGLAAIAVLFLRRRGSIAGSDRLLRFVAITLFAMAITVVFTELWPVLLIAKFQAFKLSVLLKFLFLTVISTAFVSFLPASVERLGRRLLQPGRARIILSSTVAATLLGFVVVKPAFVQTRLTHEVHHSTDLGQMETWIRDHTERDVVFAVPPSNSTFRSNAERAIVVNYAAFPFDDVDMIAWYDRLMDIAPIEPPSTGLGVKPLLDEAYHRRSTADWITLRENYSVEYLLVDLGTGTSYPFEIVHEVGHWRVYRIPSV